MISQLLPKMILKGFPFSMNNKNTKGINNKNHLTWHDVCLGWHDQEEYGEDRRHPPARHHSSLRKLNLSCQTSLLWTGKNRKWKLVVWIELPMNCPWNEGEWWIPSENIYFHIICKLMFQEKYIIYIWDKLNMWIAFPMWTYTKLKCDIYFTMYSGTNNVW